MRVLESVIDIDATPEAVWAVLTDFDHYPEWNPFITSITGASITGASITGASITGAAEPGARLAIRIAPPGGMAMTLKPRIQAADEARRLGWLGRLGLPRIFDGAHEFILEARSDGTTAFTQRETFRGILVPFTNKILERTHRGFVEMNHALKERVESRHAAVPSGTHRSGDALNQG